MEMKVLQPANPLIRRYVESIYIFEKSNAGARYIAYPSSHTAVALFRNSSVHCEGQNVFIHNVEVENYSAFASNRLFDTTAICYREMVDEIAINFKPLGFYLFTGLALQKGNFSFDSWDIDIASLFNLVFSTNDPLLRLDAIEGFLSPKYKAIDDEEILSRSLDLLSDFSTERTLTEIADELDVHYKYLTRSFSKYIGCSAAHFRKIARFRSSLYAKLKEANHRSLTDICYENNFTDQSYFIRQFRELTGERPSYFFKSVSSFADSNIVWRFV